ncbi:hypothetical protein FPE01S_01_17460 [Flavihumibacter petaseus NBRC 106054]|uniref:Uncharacterized protein n=2 Tax=Flavihumibacter TaxID=1004301 RepID=A0A0E9MYX0_9BACT|nr:hypothetical protein FPE01S_01_17460 [Flavihumibacter petaseus NBRC 106054]
MGHENIPVFGLPRKSGRRITIIICSDYLKNIRIKKTYDPALIEKIDNTSFYYGVDELTLKIFAASLNNNNREINDQSIQTPPGKE